MYIVSVDSSKNPIFAHSSLEEDKANIIKTVTEDTQKIFTGEFTVIESGNNPFEII